MTGLLVALGLSLLVVRLVAPSTDPSNRTDAVVVLAGAPDTRLPVALDLARRGNHVLVVSSAGGVNEAVTRKYCGRPSDLTVYCFRPSSDNTRGEAQAIGRLVAERGWSSITVVTNTFHVTRARLLIERCTRAQVHMAGVDPKLSPAGWVNRLAHEIGGLAEASVVRSC